MACANGKRACAAVHGDETRIADATERMSQSYERMVAAMEQSAEAAGRQAAAMERMAEAAESQAKEQADVRRLLKMIFREAQKGMGILEDLYVDEESEEGNAGDEVTAGQVNEVRGERTALRAEKAAADKAEEERKKQEAEEEKKEKKEAEAEGSGEKGKKETQEKDGEGEAEEGGEKEVEILEIE